MAPGARERSRTPECRKRHAYCPTHIAQKCAIRDFPLFRNIVFLPATPARRAEIGPMWRLFEKIWAIGPVLLDDLAGRT
jgi:hypothetical protein